MDYCTAYFGKPLRELTFHDVESFFQTERQETDQIEFKSINLRGHLDDKLSALRRSVCAFLNSSGGILIWGAPEGKKVDGKKEKIFSGAVTFWEGSLEKDSFLSSLSDKIIPLPSGIRVQLLEENNKGIAIIEIDKSEYSPHQTENAYFMRLESQTRNAPHHYIEALFKKIQHPNIEAYLKTTGVRIHNKTLRFEFEVYFFNWTPYQNEEMLAFRIFSPYGIFHNHNLPSLSKFYAFDGHEFFKNNAKEVFYYGEPYREANSIIFSMDELAKLNGRAEILITFGGRFSPRKSCEYELDFNDPSQLSSIVIPVRENRLFKDIQDEKGVDKRSILAHMLGR